MKTTKILILLIALLSIGLFARFLYFEYNLLKYPYQWGLREALQLNHAIILSEGNSLYKIGKEPPLVIEPYGPVNPCVVAVLLKIFGKTLFAPRLVSFISFLLVLLLIAYTVFSLTHSWKFVFLSIGLNSFMLSWWQWLLLCRPDSLGNLLLFLTIFIHWKFPYKRWAIFLSLLIGILGFLTKIYFVCGFGGIVLSYWFVHKDKKMAMLYSFFGFVLIITTVLIINYMTDGIYYLFTFEIISHWVVYSFDWLFDNLKELILYYFPIITLICYSVLKGSFNYKRYGVFFTHLLIGLPLFSFLLLNPGGCQFYWYSIVPSLIIIGCDLIYMGNKTSRHKVLVPVLLAIILIMTFKVGYKDILRHKLVIPSSSLAHKWEPLDNLVKDTKGHIMNDAATTILNIRAGKELYSEGLGYIQSKNYLVEKYNYSFVDINKEIAQHKFALIINPEEKAEVEKYYKLYKTYFVPCYLGQWRFKIDVFAPKVQNASNECLL